MSSHGTILPTMTDPRAIEAVAAALARWDGGFYAIYSYPRSKWLSDLETDLRAFFPRASSRDLNLTARSLAPFTLKEHP